MHTLPRPLAELKGAIGLTSIDIASSLDIRNTRILRKLNGYALQEKFMQDDRWQIVKEERVNRNKPTHLIHMNLFTAKIVILSIQTKDAQNYLVEIFKWEIENYRFSTTRVGLKFNERIGEIIDAIEEKHMSASDLSRHFGDIGSKNFIRKYGKKMLTNDVYARMQRNGKAKLGKSPRSSGLNSLMDWNDDFIN